MMKKLIALVALMVALTAIAYAGSVGPAEIAGFWMNTDAGIVSLEIAEDGSGALIDPNDGMGIPVQVKEARDAQYDFAICLGAEDIVADLSYDQESESLTLHSDEGSTVTFVRDYWDGNPAAYVAPDLSIRYSPEAFAVTHEEDGALLLTCGYREGCNDYIRISLVKDTDMAILLEGLALQNDKDSVKPDYGCWDFTAEEAGSIDYIRNEDGIDYDCFFMAVLCGDDCYLVESHCACLGDPETDPDNDLTDLFGETLGSIRRNVTK